MFDCITQFASWSAFRDSVNSYQSLFELALALNLAFTGYTEVRLSVQRDIEAKFNVMNDKIRPLLHALRTKALDHKGMDEERPAQEAAKEAADLKQGIKDLSDTYYQVHRRRLAKHDKRIIPVFLGCAFVALMILLVSSACPTGFTLARSHIFAVLFAVYCVPAWAACHAFRSGKTLRTMRYDIADLQRKVTAAYNDFFIPLAHDGRWKRLSGGS